MFKLIAGPCVIESEENVMLVAKKIKEITDKLDIPFVFKSSFFDFSSAVAIIVANFCWYSSDPIGEGKEPRTPRKVILIELPPLLVSFCLLVFSYETAKKPGHKN